jgi:hypothetical protein
MTERLGKYDILPYEEVSNYNIELYLVDFCSFGKNVRKWLNAREKNDDGLRDVKLKLGISPCGFHLSINTIYGDDCLFFTRLNHVMALQLKQACEYYINCYEKHALQSDVTIYEDSVTR